MRNNVTFQYPEPFIPSSEEDGVLSVKGAEWFGKILREIPSLKVDPSYIQEDWGVVFFVHRSNKKFWVGLSTWPEGESAWLAHIHHRSLLQRFTSSGKQEFNQLILDLQQQLKARAGTSNITWFHERDMQSAEPLGSPTPETG